MIREHFNNKGEPKVKRSKEDAIYYAADHDLNAYECTFCGWWHVGKRTS